MLSSDSLSAIAAVEHSLVKVAGSHTGTWKQAAGMKRVLRRRIFVLSCHPIELHAEAVSRLSILPASLLEQSVGQRVQLVGCLITEKAAETKHDEPMEFATFEDLTALYDATIFPKVYRSQGVILPWLIWRYAMTLLRRAQITPGVHGIDTTVKSAQGPFRALAPTWDMVMRYKNKTLSEAAYTEQYQAILRRVPTDVWDVLAAQPEVVFLCYCRDQWSCHTYLLINHLVRQWPDRFMDGRTRRNDAKLL